MNTNPYEGRIKPLRILWVSHLIPYPPKSGVLMRSYHLVRELARHHQVDLFAFVQSRQVLAHFGSLEAGIAEAKRHFEGIVGKFHSEPIPSESGKLGRHLLAISSLFRKDPYTINWLKSPRAMEQLKQYVEAGSYDLVHFDTISLAPYLSATGSLPVTLDHHNVESHMMLRRSEQSTSLFKQLYFKQEGVRLAAYEKSNLKRFEVHAVCSEDDRIRLLKIDNALNVCVVPNGIRFSQIDPNRSVSLSPEILFIGGLDWYPNADAIVHFLEKIWPLALASNPNIRFNIIGKNPSARIRQLAANDLRIKVHGYVENIKQFYERSAIYVCPIRDGGGTKLKVLDALAHKTPLVGYPAAFEGLNLQDNVHCRVARSEQEFASILCDLIRRPEDAETLGQTGYRFVRSQYDVGTIGQTLAECYSSVVKNCKSRFDLYPRSQQPTSPSV